MAIGTGMAIATGLGVAGSIIGGKMQADAATDASNASIASQEKMFQLGLDRVDPNINLGAGSHQMLENFQSVDGRNAMLDDYYGSDLYQTQQGQMSESIMRGLNANGGMRSGAAPAALSRIAPTLGNQYMSNAFNQNFALAGLGSNAANSTLGVASNVGANIGQTASNGINQAGNAKAGIVSDLTGLGLNLAGGMNFGGAGAGVSPNGISNQQFINNNQNVGFGGGF